MTFEIEKTDCIDALDFGLNRTAAWRQRMALKHPLDQRNARAVDLLAKLANETPALSNEDWLRLRPHSGWANERFREAISDAARAVGFQHKIKDLPDFVSHLVRVLSESQTDIAA
jgi:hypothetical protein